MPALYWVRNDFRLYDNSALYHATDENKDGVVAVFFITNKIWRKNNFGKNKIAFLLENLRDFSINLQKYNIPLLIKNADSQKSVNNQLLLLAKQYKCDNIYFNRGYSLDDVKQEQKLGEHGLRIHAFDDAIIVPPGLVKTQDDRFYSVFTPFKRKWLQVFQETRASLLPKPKMFSKSLLASNIVPVLDEKPKQLTYWPIGENVAKNRLQNFLENKIFDYERNRDFPSIDATSALSPYLAVGTISPRYCLEAALEINGGELNNGNAGVLAWINELIWRDFYQHLLFAYPSISEYKSFKPYGDQVKWRQDKKLFRAWQDGKTGFPIIDAAMLQLKEMGWMHNRLRMLTASFLTKLLLIDWRLGERYFAEQLIDYDFASNNGGWQWAASTGADCMPYFRVFNPELQAKKFDKDGMFVGRYLSDKSLKPIIDYRVAKDHSLHIFKQAFANSSKNKGAASWRSPVPAAQARG
ncbi:MAG: deoxyribodipyrimidine photo-lyase [Gammaproteobacteria bacterium]|nr:deoxyribodipyrimidine photo-lyase [Gammaproteobacteria bacterium]